MENTNQKHLTLEDRNYIEQALNHGMTFKEIAKFLSKDPTTISKEIKKHRIRKEPNPSLNNATSYDLAQILLDKDVLKEQIKKHEKYSLIILFDEMEPSGLEVLKSLKKKRGFKIPTVVLLDKSKESIKEHYIKDGFTDYLLLSNINEEIKKLDKYLKG